MTGIYFSGTGNTKFCVDKFLEEYDYSKNSFSIEDNEALEKIKNDNEIVIGYQVKCIGCGSCEKLCPMGNITVKNGIAVSSDKCTMCYRCINKCPTRAITLLGKKVIEQNDFFP